MRELTENQIMYLIELAVKYAKICNLDPKIYVTAMLNVDTIGQSDSEKVVAILTKYHKDWLKKH